MFRMGKTPILWLWSWGPATTQVFDDDHHDDDNDGDDDDDAATCGGS